MNEKQVSLSARRLRISLFFFFYGFSFASWASRIPTIQQTLGMSETGLGAVLLAMPIGSFLTLPFSGFLVSKIGSRKVVMISSILYGCMLMAIGFSGSVVQLTISLFLFGSSGNMMNIAINTQALALEGLYQRTIISSFHGMWSAAGLFAAFLGTYLMGKAFPVPHHFLLVGLLSLLMFVACMPYLLHDASKAKKEKTPFFPKPGKALLGLGSIAFCSMICQGAMFDWSGVYFKKEVTSNLAYIGFGYTAFMIAMTVTRFVTDWVNHHIGFKKLITLCGIFTTAGLLITVSFPYFFPCTLGMLLVGIGVSPIVPLVFSAAGKTQQSNPALAIAAVSTIGFIGLLIGPPMIGFIAGWSSLKTSFLVLSAFGLTIFAGGQLIKFDSK
jgi:MFS family permease